MIARPLDDENSLYITGLILRESESPTEFMDLLEDAKAGLAFQAVDARSVAGGLHVELSCLQAWEAWKRGVSYAKKLGVEILLRLAGTTQIQEAIDLVGVRSDVRNIILIFIGPLRPWRATEKKIRKIGRLGHRLLEPSAKNLQALAQSRRISRPVLEATARLLGLDGPIRAIPYAVAEDSIALYR